MAKKSGSGSINIGDITGSTGVAIGEQASVNNYQFNINIFTGGQNYSTSQTELVSLAEQLGQLTVALSKDVEKQIKVLRQALLEGQRVLVCEYIRELKADELRWRLLPANLKAKLLRLEAGLILVTEGNIEKSRLLAETARELAPEDDESRIRAAIARHESGPEGALLQLGNQENIEGINLSVIYLLELGRMDECQEFLRGIDKKGIEPNAETFRARALYNLLRKDITGARQEIQKALEIEPYWISNRFASGVIDYFQALSPAIFPDHLVPWPIPVEHDYFKTDDESLAFLENARKTFQELALRPELTDAEIRVFQVWHFACLAIDPENKESAINECVNLLKADPTDFRLIAWATTQDYRIDLGPSKRLLKRAVHNHAASILEIQALTCIYLTEKNSVDLAERTASIEQ